MLEPSRPTLTRLPRTCEIDWPLDSGSPFSCMNRGVLGGLCTCSKRLLRVATVQVHAPGAWAMVMVTPLLKGSIFEERTVSMMWEGDEMDGTNSMQLLVMWTLGSKILPAWMVNSPHLRNPVNAVVAAASKLSQPSREEWFADASMHVSTSHVMGSLGIHSCLPMYLLIPCMTCCSIGDLQAVN